MTIKKSILLLVVILFANVCSQTLTKQSTAASLKKSSFVPQWQYFDANNIRSAISNDGIFVDARSKDSTSLEWPKGSRKKTVYTAGVWIAGIHRPSGSVRCAIHYGDSEFQPGNIPGIFHTSIDSKNILPNPNDPLYRTYKISAGGHDTSRDFREWPGDLGAPYIDYNNNATWDPGIDRPRIIGDQTLWSVYNDGDSMLRYRLSHSRPMGLEIQSTYFGFKNGLLFFNDVLFLRLRIINKSDAYYDSTYFGIYSDTDIGYLNDDCIGVDSAEGLGYFYNGDSLDEGTLGYGYKPPAVGYVLLQTPIVPSHSADSGYYREQWIRGKKNIGVSASMLIWGYIGPNRDPYIPYVDQAYGLLKGIWPSDNSPIINPKTGLPTKFVFSGDPVTNTGWTQQNHPVNPDDMRSVLSTGPFTFAPGDTQEVVAAIIIAQGEDRLNSITKLRLNAELVKEFFYSNFSLYKFEEPLPHPTAIPQRFVLSQNYPNPFNPTTTFTYAVPQFDAPYRVKIQIFDLLGRETATLVNEHKPAGTYTVDWDASSQPSGVYYYSMTLGGLVETKKMMLLK